MTLRLLIAAVACQLSALAAVAQSPPAIRVSGDLRVRAEEDWDSHTEAGVLRPDRGRARVRARLGAEADLGSGFRAQGRVRTGVGHSQQGANVTFADVDGNPVDVLKVEAERYSLAWRDRSRTVEVGRMEFPFFATNEYFWDADIPPLGGAASVSVPVAGRTRLRLIGGGFLLPVGLASYSGHLFAGQAVAEGGPATVAAGLFRLQADRNDRDRLLLLDGNGSRDYTVAALNTRYQWRAGGRPLALTADLYRNLQGYAADPDPINRRYARERTGYVLGAAWGGIEAAGRVQLGYRYFHMERLAVDASYAHDDASRLGIPAQAANTDLQGHDLYVNFAVASHVVAGVRAIVSHRITSVEDDKRARFDVTYAF